jgi:TolB-like protein/class 3 adenylate cyclase/Flp pilus assembly protein TadD
MTDEGFKRKLTAILSADVEGYSRLMDDDEEATIRNLTDYRTAMRNLIQQHRGRVVDTTGDNLLAEFTSAVDAVNCSVEIQRELAERNTELPYERKMEFRIGVNVGDVVEEEDRIYGDGVNIAARVEGLAEAGGICISGRAYDQVANKLGLEYENLGEHQVKNISTPIRVYRVLSYPGAAAHRVIQARKAVGKKWLKIALIITPVLVLVAAGITIWEYYFHLPHVDIASMGKAAFNLPEGPSVAVLPFTNMSDDPQQDYFSDGLTENIITGLSALPKLFVIARNSSFVYKDKPFNVKQVADELGVRYVVEGSVQKAEDRVRITVQLIEASTGHHVWAEKYDRDLKGIFKLQDEITIKIMTALRINLTEGEQARLRAKGAGNLEAFMKTLKAFECFKRYNKESNVLAQQLMEEVIQLTPESAGGYLLLAATYISDLWYGSESPLISLAQASKYLKKAMALDNNHPDAYLILSYLYSMKKQHEQAIAAAGRAITLNPNSADAYAQLGIALSWSDRQLEAIDFIKKAIRLNPMPPSYYFVNLGSPYFDLGMYEKALESFMKARQIDPTNILAHLCLAGTYSIMGREKEARVEASEVLRIDPNYSLRNVEKTLPHKNRAHVKRFIEAARKAGLK